jgi:AraC family transcriptional regulator
MRASTRIDYEARIGRVLRWLDDHRDEPITPAQAAAVAAFSPYHFHRVFRGVTGESLMQCQRRLRLEAAARRLRHSPASVTEVAFDAGFDSHEGFTRAFKSRFGVAPSVWRVQESARMAAVHRAALPLPDVEIRTRTPARMVCLRHQGNFSDVAAAWERFIGLAMAAGLYTGREQLVGCYPDDPDVTPPGKVRFDVGLLTDQTVRGPFAPLQVTDLPGGRWAMTVHAGTYTTLSQTYLRLIGGYFIQEGLALADRPCIEVYRNTPMDTAEPDLRTEVWAPIDDG